MIRISEPTNQQIEEARARLFLADLKKALRDQNIRDAVLELSVDRNIHNQMVYSVHATRGGLQITGPEGRLFTPSRIPRSLSLDCWPTTHSALPGSRRQSRRTQPRDALLTLTPWSRFLRAAGSSFPSLSGSRAGRPLRSMCRQRGLQISGADPEEPLNIR
ncbi:hypothetical protein AHiyo8_01180 [Arthrobacter sp. Hiyo8]|nr:hypothetical protein AHiyo8_01180 [Arthrobacter sp. Hiyo8]